MTILELLLMVLQPYRGLGHSNRAAVRRERDRRARREFKWRMRHA